MTIDHVGIVVAALDTAVRQWESLFGYRPISDAVVNTRQKVKVLFLGKAGSLPVKLIEPSAPDSSILHAVRKGGGLHHICFRCSSVAEQISLLQQQGALVLVPPQPGEAFNNHPIAFLLAGNVNVELIDTCEKRGSGAESCLFTDRVS